MKVIEGEGGLRGMKGGGVNVCFQDTNMRARNAPHAPYLIDLRI